MKKRIFGFFLGVALWSCTEMNTENASPTFREAFFAEENPISMFFKEGWPEGMVNLNSEWIFLGKDSIPGIERDLPVIKQGEKVDLPHRISFPNHSFWYQKEVHLEKGFLLIDGDDGVQLWFDGKRIPRASVGEFFPVPSGKNIQLSIRVVNNAMAGGLRKVHWISENALNEWIGGKKQLRDSILVERKVELLSEESWKEKLEQFNWLEKERELEEFPILLTDPILMLGTDQTWFLRWVSEKGGIVKLRHSGGEELELSADDGVFTFPMKEDSISFSLWQEKSFQGNFEFSKPKIGKSIKLALWGDSQGGWTTFHQLAKLIGETKVDLSIGAGDLVNNGSEEFVYPRFLQKLSLMKTAQLPVPGNHDYDGYYEELDPVSLRTYVFRGEESRYGFQQLGPLAILTLDPNENFPVSIPEKTMQREMLEKVLDSESWKNNPWKMVVLHQPPYSQGWQGYHGEHSIRELLEPYFHQGKIDVVVGGHTHDYERLTKEFSGNQVHFLILGGAGGGLESEGKDSEFPKMDKIIKKNHVGIVDVRAEDFKLQILGISGEILDEVRFRKIP